MVDLEFEPRQSVCLKVRSLNPYTRLPIWVQKCKSRPFVLLSVLSMYLSSQYVQEGQKARCGAIRPEIVLKITPQTWFLKTTLAFPVVQHHT